MTSDPSSYSHIPVIASEVMDLLAPQPGETAVDGTVGLGGHSRLIGTALGREGRLVCFDRDPEAIGLARENLRGLECGLEFVNLPFESMDTELARRGIGNVRRVLLDLGVSSLQLDKPERGFSFMRDGPLDMRMNPEAGQSAREVVSSWPEERLADAFYSLGEEPHSRRIAKIIVETRAKRPIATTGDLSSLVASVVPRRGRIHPATKVFQALRMIVNDEMGTLSRGLAAAGRVLVPGGRLAVITFHSLEDRLVKRTFLAWRARGLATLVNVKAVGCGEDEASANRRARSAKLRVVERVG